jgi:AbrB family looped-hinge helix DNA binding protein
MKLGTFTRTNEKGQIVIPQAMRKSLGIDANVILNIRLTGNGIYIYPIDDFITKTEGESSYLQLLETTKGTWANGQGSKDEKKQEKIQSDIELKAAKARKDAW